MNNLLLRRCVRLQYHSSCPRRGLVAQGEVMAGEGATRSETAPALGANAIRSLMPSRCHLCPVAEFDAGFAICRNYGSPVASEVHRCVGRGGVQFASKAHCLGAVPKLPI